ncbi:MAG TPA: hypothetical protein VFF43_01350, partial [Caldimonas sp.]|nr:hypothetical protein [Caldimonas sp.]
SEDRRERERVLLAQGNDDAVVGSGSLQFEVERPAEAFAKGETPRAIDPSAERCVDDKLHAAGLVEKALGDDACARRHRSEDRSAVLDVAHHLLCAKPVEAALALQVVRR